MKCENYILSIFWASFCEELSFILLLSIYPFSQALKGRSQKYSIFLWFQGMEANLNNYLVEMLLDFHLSAGRAQENLSLYWYIVFASLKSSLIVIAIGKCDVNYTLLFEYSSISFRNYYYSAPSLISLFTLSFKKYTLIEDIVEYLRHHLPLSLKMTLSFPLYVDNCLL